MVACPSISETILGLTFLDRSSVAQVCPEDISLEELVSKDNFYRRLQEKLDLSFVRELVEDRYATSGRPSILASVHV
jgi:hypothetical protein